MVLAQVVEDRGPIGYRGRRLYGVRLDFALGESTTFEVPEEDLEAATEAERTAWRTTGSLAVHQTMTYSGKAEDPHGLPMPWYHYLVVAKPGHEPGSGVASIFLLSGARAMDTAQGPPHTVVAKRGGPEAALALAEEYLDNQHPGLRKIVGERKP
jgi:hypothetical protein